MRWFSTSTIGTETPPPPGTGEYSTVSLRSTWGIASLLLFAAALAVREILGLLPPRLQGHYLIPPLAVRLTPLLSLVGLLFGLIGLRRGARRTIALFGVGLNGIVLVLSTLFMVVLWWVWLR